MRRALGSISQFLVTEDGPTAAEYAVTLGLITVALLATISSLAASMSGIFSSVSSTLGGGS
jgi:Flp pilus assembly pilin Flp